MMRKQLERKSTKRPDASSLCSASTAKPKTKAAPKTNKPTLRLEWVEAGSLSRNPRNWRLHPPEQTKALGALLSDPEIGWAGAVLFNERSKQLIDGHARLDLVDAKTPVPVLIGKWSPAAELKILATLDPIAGLAEVDGDQLQRLLAEVDLSDAVFDELLTGLNDDLAEALDAPQAPIVQDDIPEPPKRAVTKAGDLWELGVHRLLCGDAGSSAHADQLIGSTHARLMVTSPPYNQNLKGMAKPTGMHKRDGFFLRMSTAYSGGENMPEPEYQAWQIACLNLWWERVTEGGSCFYNHKLRYRKRTPIVPLEWLWKTKWKLRQEIIWDRGGGVVLNAEMFIPSDERWYWLEKPGKHVWNGLGMNRTNIWKVSTGVATEHVVDFPVAIVAIPIEYVTHLGDIVVDPFIGSGSTMIAAEQLGRRCYGMEIEPRYCDVIIERWEKLTGSKAKRSCQHKSNGRRASARPGRRRRK